MWGLFFAKANAARTQHSKCDTQLLCKPAAWKLMALTITSERANRPKASHMRSLRIRSANVRAWLPRKTVATPIPHSPHGCLCDFEPRAKMTRNNQQRCTTKWWPTKTRCCPSGQQLQSNDAKQSRTMHDQMVADQTPLLPIWAATSVRWMTKRMDSRCVVAPWESS